MRAAKKKLSVDNKVLQELVPLNALSADRFREVADKIVVEEVLAGRYLFRKGDRDNQSIYILEGTVNLIDGFRKVTSEVEAGTDISRYPIANQQPRTLSARAVKKVVIARIDSSLLDAFLTWDQSSTADAIEIGSESNEDWMTRLLQSEAFIKIPPSMIQSLLIKMEQFPVKADQTIISQGDEGDYFYTIHEGRCAVTRHESPGAEEIALAELGSGDSFGEDALVSDARRNASVTMLTDGLLMRLAKRDFVDLLKNQLVRRVDHAQASAMVDEGAVWIDVRTPDEYNSGAFEDSVNMPLASLRDELSELVFNSKYIICCDTGRRSESAGFLLSHKGFDVYVLDGGMTGLNDSPLADAATTPATTQSETAEADVIDLATVTTDIAADTAEKADAVHADSHDADTAHAALQEENAELQGQVESLRENERRLTGQLEQLRAELGESGEKLAGLYEQARTDAEQLELLRAELGESGEKLSSLYASQSEAGEDNGRLRQENQSLQASLESRTAEHEQVVTQLEHELEESRNARDALEKEHAAAAEARRSDDASQGQALEQLTQENATLGVRLEQVEQDLLAARTELESVPSIQQQAARAEGLEMENARLEDTLKQSQDELKASRETAQQAETRAREQQQALEQELEGLRSGLQDHEGLLAEATSGHDEASARVEALEKENETLRTELREQGVKLDEHLEQVENLQSDREAAEDVVQRQQADWESERAELQQALEGEREAVNELREMLADAETLAKKDRDELANELNARLTQSNEKIEQLEVARVDLSRQFKARGEELEAAAKGHERQQQEMDSLLKDCEALRSENEALRAGDETHAATLAEQESRLQAEVESAQQRCEALEQLRSEQDAELQQLRAELESHANRSDSVREECALLQKQLEQSGDEVTQLKARAEELEEERQQTGRRAQEELDRKIDNEKELQSQLERLRKSMAQQTEDYRKGREETLSDIENLREQLNSERRERDDERAEMAARQRELKDQLALAASEHESNLNRQSGEIQQARDAVREEEQERLREMLVSQAETENLVDRLQAELKSAHEEISDLTREQKDRRETDAGLMEEQNQQATETIKGLETQLRQLTEERDGAVNEQRELREALDSLRGEVEVARGLMGAVGQVEDPAQLRNELEESKKNVEIALRLRAEAEAARDRLQQERDRLQQRLGNGETDDPGVDETATDAPLHVPSLDGGPPPGAVHPGPGESLKPATLPVTPTEREQDAGADAVPLVDTQRDNRQRRWLGAAIGLGAMALCGVAGWFYLGGPQSPQEEEVVPAEASAVAGSQMSPSAETPAEVADVSAAPTPVPAPAPKQESAPVASEASPRAEADIQAAATETVTTPEPEQADIPAVESVSNKAVRSFQDSLSGGGKGPVMLELPGGQFQMGSVGKSLNFDEVPRHAVTVNGFAISQHEVTFAEYDQFARATGRRLPYDETWGRGDRPVINVSWADAVAYARWLSKQSGANYRLPTEAEWEYAARAGTTGNYWWKDTDAAGHANCFNCGSQWDGVSTAPTGSFTANEFGLHDVSGNVQEWTADCYHGSYKGAPADASAWVSPGCEMRVVRGGAYTSPLDSLRSAKRSQYSQDARLDNIGFRVVREN